MPGKDPHADAEAWFRDHGLPYFVDDVRVDVRRRLNRPRLLGVLAIGVATGSAAGIVTGLWGETGSGGFTTGLTVLLIVVSAYALRALQTAAISRWAARRALGSLQLLVPLVTRALPMLLLFVTFFFFTTEIWQALDALSWGVLGSTVLFFGLAGIFFLVARLGEELDDVDDLESTAEIVEGCQGTPLHGAAVDLAARRLDLAADVEVAGLEKANLVLTLVIAQAVQVLLLSVAVTTFFVGFGSVAIDVDVIETWIGSPPDWVLVEGAVSVQLVKVAIFLGSFSGLYFTVYAVTDATYRQEFFSEILKELERAVAVRAVYRHLQDVPE